MNQILRFNYLDSDNEIFQKGSLIFENPVPVLENFNPSEIIGLVNIIEKNNGLYADFSKIPWLKGLFPAIGFQETKVKVSLYDSICISGKIFAIGVSNSTNIDPEIKPI